MKLLIFLECVGSQRHSASDLQFRDFIVHVMLRQLDQEVTRELDILISFPLATLPFASKFIGASSGLEVQKFHCRTAGELHLSGRFSWQRPSFRVLLSIFSHEIFIESSVLEGLWKEGAEWKSGSNTLFQVFKRLVWTAAVHPVHKTAAGKEEEVSTRCRMQWLQREHL